MFYWMRCLPRYFVASLRFPLAREEIPCPILPKSFEDLIEVIPQKEPNKRCSRLVELV
jgi:hypothetical protein